MPDSFWFEASKPLLGTFVGALGAFVVAKINQDLQRERQEIAAGNMAIATIGQQIGDLASLRQVMAAELRNRSQLPIWVQFRPIPIVFDRELRFDFAALAFLIDGPTQHFSHLAQLQRWYLAAADALDEHRITAKAIQDKLNLAIGHAEVLINGPVARSAVGENLISQQTSLVEMLRFYCSKEREFRDTGEEINDAMRARFGYRRWFKKVTLLQLSAARREVPPTNPPPADRITD